MTHLLAVGGEVHGRRIVSAPGGVADAPVMHWPRRNPEAGDTWIDEIYVRSVVDLPERSFTVWLFEPFEQADTAERIALVLDAILVERDQLVGAAESMVKLLDGAARAKADLQSIAGNIAERLGA